MNRLRLFLFFSFTSLLLFSQAVFAQKEVPELWNARVHDEAKVLSQATIDNLEHTLKVFEDSTSNQMAILIVPSLDGEIIEQYALRVAEKWKLGTKDRDNGIVMLIAIGDRKMRIEVGQGLEGVITDALANRIIRNEMAPNFRRGDYDAGVLAATNAIMLASKGEYKADPIAKRNGRGGSVLFGLIIIVILGSFTWSALFTKGCAGWGLYGFLSPFYAILPGIALGSSVSWLTILISYLVAFPILKLILGRTAWGQGISQQMADSAKKNRSGGWSSGGRLVHRGRWRKWLGRRRRRRLLRWWRKLWWWRKQRKLVVNDYLHRSLNKVASILFPSYFCPRVGYSVRMHRP